MTTYLNLKNLRVYVKSFRDEDDAVMVSDGINHALVDFDDIPMLITALQAALEESA